MEEIIARLLQDFEHGKMTRRRLIQSLALTATAASAATVPAASMAASGGFKAIAVHHLSYGVADYARTRDFYVDLLGMQVRGDNGTQCSLVFGDSFIVVRKTQQADNKPDVDHFAIAIDDWNKEAVEAELKRRHLDPKPDGDTSFLIKDPDGYELQISAGRRPKPSPL